MYLHVVIPTHNRVDRLCKLLDSLIVIQQMGRAFPDKITVIENGSEVTQPAVEKYYDQLPICFQQIGTGNKSVALNHVLDRVKDEELLLFFDDDIRLVDHDIFSKYKQAFQKFGADCYFGGELIPEYEVDPEPSLIPFMPQSNRGFHSSQPEHHLSELKHFFGCNWAVLAKNLKAVGGFDNSFGPGAKSGARGQETDVQKKIARNGLSPIMVPGTEVAHFVPAKYLTKEWIWQRQKFSAMYRGRTVGNIFKATYWLLCAKWYGVFGRSLDMQMKSAVYHGYFAGWKLKD